MLASVPPLYITDGPWETLVERVPLHRTLITAITSSAVPILPMSSLWLVQTDSERSHHVMDSNAGLPHVEGWRWYDGQALQDAACCCCCWQLVLHQHACMRIAEAIVQDDCLQNTCEPRAFDKYEEVL